MTIQSLKGTRSLYPKDFRARRALVEGCKDALERFGYEEYEAPILEPLALYEAKSSAEIIERQSYTFTDRGGNRVVVRPELTPSFARMVANKQSELPSLIRWYSFADCWRYERPQKGRTRNFLQLNVDFLGSDSVEADVEIIDVAFSILQSAGIDMSKIKMQINDRSSFDGVCKTLKIKEEDKNQFLTLLDSRQKISEERFLSEIRILNPEVCVNDLKYLGEIKASDRLNAVMESVSQLGWTQLVYSPELTRGFSYYTGIVFEVVETSGQFRRAIFGGGRYGNLLESVGGKPASGVGFGVSDVALLTALKTQKIEVPTVCPQTVFVIPFSQKEQQVANKISKQLREKGKRVIGAVPPFELKKQLALANRLLVSDVVMVMPDELKRNEVLWKNLKTGEQRKEFFC